MHGDAVGNGNRDELNDAVEKAVAGGGGGGGGGCGGGEVGEELDHQWCAVTTAEKRLRVRRNRAKAAYRKAVQILDGQTVPTSPDWADDLDRDLR
jgi:hypothetical protein